MTDLLEFAQSMSRPEPRMGRPPGNPPARIDWKDPAQKREYKAAQQRERKAQQIAEQLAARKKPCTGLLCNGAVRSFDEFYPDPEKPLGVESRCKDCKNEARKQRYQAQLERERQRSKDYYANNPDVAKTRYMTNRQQAIQIYGGQCEMCGDTHKLEFDHVNWDGAAHRMVEEAHAMVVRIAKTGARITDYELRLVCGPCHRGLRPAFTRRMLAMRIAGANNWPTISL